MLGETNYQIKRRLVTFLLLFVSSSPVLANSLWDHNGSVLRLEADGPKRRLLYQEPRTGLAVEHNTVLFDGVQQGKQYTGTAYKFSRKCGPVGFLVEGIVSADEQNITLRGQSPKRTAYCGVIGQTDEVLIFTLRSPPENDVGQENEVVPDFRSALP